MTVVNAREALIAWYVRRSYLVRGDSKPFPYEEHSDSMPLRDDYCLVVLQKELKSS